MEKGEIACHEQFLHFPQCFQLNQITLSPFVHICDIISLFAVELEELKIGISGKGLTLISLSASFYFQNLYLCNKSIRFLPRQRLIFSDNNEKHGLASHRPWDKGCPCFESPAQGTFFFFPKRIIISYWNINWTPPAMLVIFLTVAMWKSSQWVRKKSCSVPAKTNLRKASVKWQYSKTCVKSLPDNKY